MLHSEGIKALHPFPYTLPYASFIISFYNKPVNVGKCFSEFSESHSSKLIEPQEEIVETSSL